MYQRNAQIVSPPGDLFRESSWFAVYTGQGVLPQAHHPFADIPPADEIERRMQIISGDVQKRVESFPTHDEYIRQHCAAPPLAGKPM
jgi:tryptophan halogenase